MIDIRSELERIVEDSHDAFADKALQVSALSARLAALKFLHDLDTGAKGDGGDPYEAEERDAKTLSDWMQGILETE